MRVKAAVNKGNETLNAATGKNAPYIAGGLVAMARRSQAPMCIVDALRARVQNG